MKEYNYWYNKSEQLCQEHSFTRLFSISAEAQRKIAVALTYVTYQSGLLTDETNAPFLPHGKLNRKCQLFLLSVRIWIEYLLFWLFWTFFKKGRPLEEAVQNSNVDVWVLSGTNTIDLFPNIEEMLSPLHVHKLLIPNKNFFNSLQFLSQNHSFLNPIRPSITVLFKMFRWIQSGECNCFLESFTKLFPLEHPVKMFHFLADQLLRLFYHREWARFNASLLYLRSTARTVLMENDFFGNMMMLAEEANSRGYHTIHVQHGFMDDPHHYFPLCKYIFVNSEKDRDLLVSVGLDSERAIVTGAPLQVLAQEPGKNSDQHLEYDLVILASWGNPKLQERCISAVRGNTVLFQDKRVLLRLHPSLPPHEKNNWKTKLASVAKISIGNSLVNDLKSSARVVSFSIDAMITAMRMHKPTILYISDPLVYYRPLETMQGLQCVYNEIEFHQAIVNSMAGDPPHESIDEEMDLVFGSTSADVVKERMFSFINILLRK